jgi:hypothetical protein
MSPVRLITESLKNFPIFYGTRKSCGFHGGDYEECRLLGYESPVRTSQETYDISATEPCQLMLYKIGGFHGGAFEECRRLGCDAMWLL